MKSVLIALLLVAIVLLVGSEARRFGGKGKQGGRPGGRPGGKPWLKKCPPKCSDCQEGVCRACDEKFALKNITSRRFTKTKTICVPCWRLEGSDSVYLEQCVECPRNCSDCQEGVCHACDEDFALITTCRFNKTKTSCVACGPKLKRKNRALYHDQCAECPRNCSDCQDGVCHACDEDFALKNITTPRGFKKTICVRSKPECPRNCLSCEDGNCTTCDSGFFRVQTRLLNRTKCVSCGWKLRKYWPDVHAKECPQKGKGKRKNPSV